MPSKVKEIEARYSKPLAEILKELYERHGNQRAVASELGVGQGTISLWFNRCGFEFKGYRATLVDPSGAVVKGCDHAT